MLTRFVANPRAGAWKLALLLSAFAAAACGEDPEGPGFLSDASQVGPGQVPPAQDGGATVVPGTDAGNTGVVPNPTTDAHVSTPPMEAGPGPTGQPEAGVAVDASNPSQPDAQSDAGPSSGGDGGTAHEDLGKGDGKDVVAIGDSWMNLGTAGIQQSLLKASGQKYRVYGVAGVELLNSNLFGPAIPTQYDRAKKEGPIKTVVMTGGGNDILMGVGGAMATIDKVGVRLAELWKQMHEDGVQDVVYVEYSRGGSNKENVEYGISKVKPACAAAPLRCHFVDSDVFIMMQLRIDGIHPTNAGYDTLGKAVFDLMTKEGMRR